MERQSTSGTGPACATGDRPRGSKAVHGFLIHTLCMQYPWIKTGKSLMPTLSKVGIQLEQSAVVMRNVTGIFPDVRSMHH
ncbi:hypothetical protein RRG08_014850 [Elysia crispata]|uniref:Uncharacterized protein n=1 Tax=Elysia crispata TaxID=231223 RepID=A0AAE0Z6Y2_9GAST|nr:hypothetical protein RRG08_014850 [Elysia crispata]